jgi:hypothetical protein
MAKSTDKRFEAMNKMLDDLLGPVEEWSDRDVDKFLADAGVDMDVANRTLFDRVSGIASTYRARNQDVPAPIVDLLRQMRPVEIAAPDPETAKNVARKWISRLRRPTSQLGAPQIAYAFRNKRHALAPKDQAVLDALEEKLKTRKGGN